jgi:ribosomal protein S18 acetylase RimI-like enzyme
LRPWPNDPSSLLLVLIDHSTIPDHDDIAAAVEQARQTGAARLRTSALFPRAAEIAVAAGFEPIDTLALLRRSVGDDIDTLVDGRPANELRTLRSWHDRRAAEVDRQAFGPVWGNDAASLRDVRAATPVHHARYVGASRHMSGFAISGAGGDSGYVQRLAVASGDRRHGIGRQLVIDALRWMRERRLSTAHVNTGIDNVAALALYEGLGFVRLDDHLTIAERRLVP